jgi:hypothetical protein
MTIPSIKETIDTINNEIYNNEEFDKQDTNYRFAYTYEFFKHLALCNTVQIERKSSKKKFKKGSN